MSEQFEQGQRLKADAANDLIRSADRVARLSAVNGLRATVSPGGISISTASRGVAIREPAIAVEALNVGSVDLAMFAPAGVAGMLAPDVNAKQYQRVLKVTVPGAEDVGFFAICAEPIAAGRVGRVYIMGACLAMVRNQNAQDFCDVEANAATLLAADSGGAQILWEDTFAGADPHLALIRFPFGGAGAHTGSVGVKAAGTVLATPLDGIAINDGDRVLMVSGASAGVHLRQNSAWIFEGQPNMVGVARGAAYGRRIYFYTGVIYVRNYGAFNA